LRGQFQRFAVASSKVKRGKKEEGEKYKDYFEFSEKVQRMASHRVLALFRAEKEGILSFSVNVDEERAIQNIHHKISRNYASNTLVDRAVTESYKRILQPNFESEIKKELKEKAVKKVVKKPQVIDEDALIKEKLAQKQKLFEKELEERKLEQERLEQLQKEELAREEEFRKIQLAKKNLLEKQKNIYLSELAIWIKQHLKYPRHARRMNQEGVVKISFIITKYGDIESVKIGSACPYKRLNLAAKSLLVELSRFKPLPQNLDRWELSVPIIYALKD